MHLFILLLLLAGCQGNELNLDASRRNNQKGEFLNRTSTQVTEVPPMAPVALPAYAWDKGAAKGLPKITKEYFRCKGSNMNPVRSETLRGEVVKHHDCGGAQKHSLPLKNGKEWVSPALIELLTYLQNKTGKRLVITSGHRCPEHNTYVDSSPMNQSSKHMIGAEVDFYVQGMEEKPEALIPLIMEYYKTHPQFKGKKEYIEFKRYEKPDANVLTQPWYNKEIYIKLFRKKEGRNFDNRHPYPYLSLQVRHDRETNEKVSYSWDQAFGNFLRY